MHPVTDSSQTKFGRQLHDRLAAAQHRLGTLEQSLANHDARRHGEKLSADALRRINGDLERAFVEVDEAAASYEKLWSAARRATGRADLLFLVSPIPCLVLDRSALIVDANPAAARMLHLSHRHLLGRHFDLFVGSERIDFVNRLGLLDRGAWVTRWPLVIRPRERGSLRVIFAASVDEDDQVVAMLLPVDGLDLPALDFEINETRSA